MHKKIILTLLTLFLVTGCARAWFTAQWYEDWNEENLSCAGQEYSSRLEEFQECKKSKMVSVMSSAHFPSMPILYSYIDDYEFILKAEDTGEATKKEADFAIQQLDALFNNLLYKANAIHVEQRSAKFKGRIQAMQNELDSWTAPSEAQRAFVPQPVSPNSLIPQRTTCKQWKNEIQCTTW